MISVKLHFFPHSLCDAAAEKIIIIFFHSNLDWNKQLLRDSSVVLSWCAACVSDHIYGLKQLNMDYSD